MRVLIAGDFCPVNHVSRIIQEGNYGSILGQVKKISESSDYSIVNLECPIITTIGDNIKKTGPSLNCSPKVVDALKYAGFQCVSLANNHFYDKGEKGVRESIQTLENSGLDYVGGGYCKEDAAKTLYKTVKGKRLAIINCCEHEFSIATSTTGGSNPLNPVRQYYAISEAKKIADIVLVIVHGGIEHFQFPTKRMVETYRFFIDVGADAVINHHQHCFCGYEIWNGKPIFYGLGNLCFDWDEKRSKLWDEGFMVMIDFDKRDDCFQLYPYTQNKKSPGVSLMNISEKMEWKTHFDAISRIISNDKELDKKYSDLLYKTERAYAANLTPYTNRYTLALYMRHLLPMLLPKSKLRLLLNMFMCESHYDRMISMLQNYSR